MQWARNLARATGLDPADVVMRVRSWGDDGYDDSELGRMVRAYIDSHGWRETQYEDMPGEFEAMAYKVDTAWEWLRNGAVTVVATPDVVCLASSLGPFGHEERAANWPFGLDTAPVMVAPEGGFGPFAEFIVSWDTVSAAMHNMENDPRDHELLPVTIRSELGEHRDFHHGGSGALEHRDRREWVREACAMVDGLMALIKSVDSGVVVRSNEAEVRRAEMVLKNTRNPKKRRKAERVYRRTVYAFERPPQKSGGGGGRGTGAGVAKHRVRAHWHHYWVGPSHRGWEMGIKSNEDDTRRLVRKLVLGYERGSVEPDRSIIAVR